MERKWRVIANNVCTSASVNEITRFYGSKNYTEQEIEKIFQRRDELIPIYEKFIELNSTNLEHTIPGVDVVDINKLCDKFSEFLRVWERSEKIKKVTGKIKSRNSTQS